MKFRTIIFSLFIPLSCLMAFGQNNDLRSLHRQTHTRLLANAKSGMDKSIIKDFIKQDVDRRENTLKEENPFSQEARILVGDLLKEARTHIGKRYRRGSKGPSSFDCSGFSGYVFRQFGYDLGASSRDQYHDGEAVDRKDLRAGDLVFFKGRNTRGGIGHVGIVVKADNEKGTFSFIHASTSQGIRIDSNDGYYARRFVGARRIIND